jgi:hypothetical protein
MNNLTKIVIVIPCWKRADILSITMDNLDNFYHATKTKIDLTVLYIFSLNDPELKNILFNFRNANHPKDYIYSENKQLGKKLNDGIQYASLLQYDYIMNFGSDDLIHPDIIDLYMPYLALKIPMFGLKSVWFYEFDKQPFFFSYYNKNHIVGAGRMIHKNVIEKVTEKFGGIYDSNINRGMDTMSENRILECGYKQLIINSGTFPFIVDIKSETNINSFSDIRNSAKSKRCLGDEICDLENFYPVLFNYKQHV